MNSSIRILVALLCLGVPAAALADATDDAEAAEVEDARAAVADQIQLLAFDLLDELVYGWTKSPFFGTETPVVLAGISVPVGLGTGLEALLENHFAALLIANPSAKIVLSHCPECSAVVVHSGAKGTIVSRGVDAPGVLAAAGGLSGGRHALFLDFEVESTELVLRARITELTKALPIVYAKTLSSSSRTAALLREPEHLKSAAEARREYQDVLEGRGPVTVPLRFVVRSYATNRGAGMAAAPFVWLQAGAEVALTQARAWTASFQLGYTWAPESHDGWLAQARVNRLISGRVRSLTAPDLYLFIGGAAVTISGAAALAFRNRIYTTDDLLAASRSLKEPRSTFAAWQLGLELRVKNRIGASVFLETMPALDDAPALGNHVDMGILEFQSLGAEVTFCF